MTDITTTVTFADLISGYDDELDDLEAAYEDTVAYATDEYGEERPGWPDDLRQQAHAYDQAAMALQKRQHVLETLRERYDDGTFELKMLTGQELTAIETQLRMKANTKDVPPSVLQADRKQMVADAACVDAPESVPRDEDGSPEPSACPNALSLSLFEAVERFNAGGDTGFRPEGFGETTPSGPSTSDRRKSLGSLPDDSDPPDETIKTPGTDS